MKLGLFEKNLQKSTMLIVIVFVAAILTDSLTHGQVNVEPNTALLNEGDRTELLCRYGRPLNYCRIEIPGEKVLNLSPDWSKTPGFTYHGAGLTGGECGVSIERVKASNNGPVKCSLGIEGEEMSGIIDLVVALRPQQPIIELITKSDREGYFNEGSSFQARCIVRDGRPAANITWLIDDLPADKRVGQLEVVASPADNNLELLTTVQEIQWHLGAEDNGRKLICRSHHQTDRENVPPQEGAYLLLVRFAPIRQSEALVYGLYLDHTAMVNMTIRSNPAPVVEWTVDGNVITQGTQNGRFSVYEPQYLGHDYYNVTMAIAGLTLEDTTKTYQMRASNSLGATDYTVRISSSSTPPIAGLDIGAIVGIVVAIAILIIIVLLILFARVTGRWCFGGKSVKTTTNETEKGQHLQHGQNVALLETPNGVTIIGNKPITERQQQQRASVAAHPALNGSPDRLSVVQRRPHSNEADEDDSFEYATDRESSVYNPTTVPMRTTIGMMGAAGGRMAQPKNARSSGDTEANDNIGGGENSDLLSRGSQLGIPESRFSRWIPKDQREILEKQAKLLANRMPQQTPEPQRVTRTPVTTAKPQPPTETEIYSDTESADIKATSTATTATTTAAATATETEATSAAASVPAPATGSATDTHAPTTENLKKSKRLPSFAAIFRRLNERDGGKKKHRTVEDDAEAVGDGAEGIASDGTDGNDNEPKEDKQLVYAELVLKPASDNSEPPIPPPKNSTEYAEIVYVQKNANAEQQQQSKK